MQHVTMKMQSPSEIWRPARVNEVQVAGFVLAIDFVANDGMAEVG